MTIYSLKSAFVRLLSPFTRLCAHAGISPNQITLAALVLSVMYGVLMLVFPIPALYLGFPILCFVRMALNAIDGQLARTTGQQTPLGGYLNEVGDVVADAMLMLPFLCVAGLYPPLLVAVIVLTLLCEFVGVLGAVHGSQRNYRGPAGKSDRAFLLGLFALLEYKQWLQPWMINLYWGVFVALLLWTIRNRFLGYRDGPAKEQ